MQYNILVGQSLKVPNMPGVVGCPISFHSQSFILFPFLVYDKYYQGKAKLDWTEESPVRDDDDDETVQESVKLEKRYSSEVVSTINLLDERLIPYDLIIRLLERICFDDPSNVSYSAAILIFMPGLAEIRRLYDMLMEHPSFGNDHFFQIFPLHSTLSSENQGAVFDVPPEGVRKIVIGMYCYGYRTIKLSLSNSHQYCGDWHHDSRYNMRH